MERSEVQARIKKTIARVIKIDEASIGDTANFIFDLGADSMQSMELVAAFEEEFDLQMDEEKALEVQSVDAAVDFIYGYLK
ncbi:acyl carrier protein [candidate division KSB1 bacterium]|nr:acyl carrier protein [candidate division KSB1 bacterium]